MKRRRLTPKRRRTGSRPRCEWLGGRITAPFYVEDGDESYRPELVMWVEVPSGLVVDSGVVEPSEAEGAVGRALASALERPPVGVQRAPGRIRVANAALAEEVRAAVGSSISVSVSPTPELDATFESLLASMPDPDGTELSYLGGGRLEPRTLERLFSAAEILYRTAPWTVATDDRVLRMDIPAMGVEGACVSIIGNLDEARGLLFFPSLDGYEAFLDAADRGLDRDGPIDLGSEWLALDFEPGVAIPPSMRREVMSHGWPLADPDAYPVLESFDRDGLARPATEQDFAVAAACAISLSTFFMNHRGVFEARAIEPVCESYFDEDELEVRFTIPYEAFPLFEIPGESESPRETAARARPGRNDPCHCGSGRKYKKCHLAADEEEASGRLRRERGHDLDELMVADLSGYALQRFGDEWRGFLGDFADPTSTLQLAGPWSVYHYEIEGAPVVERYLEEHGKTLSREERDWLVAQGNAWLSVWEISEVEPGQGLTLRDLLSGEVRHVAEVLGSRILVVRDAILARVVDCDGVSLLCGVHPQPLPPAPAADVVRRARGRLRRKRDVPVERLREEAFGRYLIGRWEAMGRKLAAPSEGPELRNTDGDPFLSTMDHYRFAPGDRASIEARLGELEGVEPPDEDEEPPVYVFLRPGNEMHASWENTVIGQVRLAHREIVVETNSRERADALRERLEAACGTWIQHRAREHADPLSSRAAPSPALPAQPPPPEAEQLLLELKERHYADWPDHALPALNGKTPREAVGTAEGRAAVDILLKEMENHEQSMADSKPFDFSRIRRELGVE